MEKNFKDQLVLLANAARGGLMGMDAQRRDMGFERFPWGSCGDTAHLIGRIVFERTGRVGTWVVGDHHPALKSTQTHAWMEIDGFIVDLTYDQFDGTGLTGWVLSQSPWHAGFARRTDSLMVDGAGWGKSFPVFAYAAMKQACEAVVL